jgi:hypothetical protein
MNLNYFFSRKFYAFCLCMVALTPLVSAQNKWSYGPRLGANYTMISNSEFSGRQYVSGFNGGAFAEYQINKFFSVQAGLDYSIRQNTYIDTSSRNALNLLNVFGLDPDDPILGGITGLLNTRVYETTRGFSRRNHLDFPVCGVINLGKNFQISLGAFGSYLLNARSNEEFSQRVPLLEAVNLNDSLGLSQFVIGFLFPAYNNPQTSKVENTSRYNSFQYGLTGGINYRNEYGFRAGARFSWGLNDYRSNPGGNLENDRFFNFYAGYDLDYLVRLIKKSVQAP